MKERVLFHTCCAPCLIAPYAQLKSEDEVGITAYWYNDNIHPYKEYEARFASVVKWCEDNSVKLIAEDSYLPRRFMGRITGREDERCYFCYYYRLLKTAETAKREGYDAFSTSLLYSLYQKHSLIKKIGAEIEQRLGIKFFYRDFRPLWHKGKKMSVEASLYRQKYCGCLYSEEERWRTEEQSLRLQKLKDGQ